MLDHVSNVTRLRTLWQAANKMGSAIDDPSFRSIFISLLGEEWDTVVPVLHTFKMSAEVISFVNMHAERILNRTPSAVPPTALNINTQDPVALGTGGIASETASGQGEERRGTTFTLTMWSTPEGVMSVYDGAGTLVVSFRGEEVLASPELLMAWNEATEATTTIDVQPAVAAAPSHLGFDVSLAPTDTSFDFVDTVSSLDMVSELDDDEPPLAELDPSSGRNLSKVEMEEKLQQGQPYPGDIEVQDEYRFLVYKTVGQHVVLHNMMDVDIFLPSTLFHDPEFDVVQWYTAPCCVGLGMPARDEFADMLPISGEDSPDGVFALTPLTRLVNSSWLLNQALKTTASVPVETLLSTVRLNRVWEMRGRL
ncbi:hypothetical protein K438DRAFT_1973358 [Mycena galopus ATCC 62051]|nr:hypothetical protein K438DRAFT_1973358 [Mycena galopus ATCC 62051]